MDTVTQTDTQCAQPVAWAPRPRRSRVKWSIVGVGSASRIRFTLAPAAGEQVERVDVNALSELMDAIMAVT